MNDLLLDIELSLLELQKKALPEDMPRIDSMLQQVDELRELERKSEAGWKRFFQSLFKKEKKLQA